MQKWFSFSLAEDHQIRLPSILNEYSPDKGFSIESLTYGGGCFIKPLWRDLLNNAVDLELLCKAFEADYQNRLKKLQRSSEETPLIKVVFADQNGGKFVHWCIDIHYVPLWICGLIPKKLSEQMCDKVTNLQSKLEVALNDVLKVEVETLEDATTEVLSPQ